MSNLSPFFEVIAHCADHHLCQDAITTFVRDEVLVHGELVIR